ncbi:TPA: transporter substrate-binding domain-containing protein [Streptococcus pneumoniae]
MKKWMLVLVSLMTALFLVACGKNSSETSGDNWSKYQSNKSITIGFDSTFVPMGFAQKDGSYAGFDIDLATAVFEKYGITVNWQPIDWDLKEAELTKGTIDLIWNGYSATDERREKVAFSNSYMNPNHSYLSQLDVTYKTPDLMSHFLPPHEVSFTFCCSSIVFPR